ncbi:hypothetical protein AYO47_08730 [Planctomyces sp. SCGC AG-212-M04]|nr:hypothetical protein AYO47_08730 [Planctomyces sp. SCGC AG-212-M04]
MPLSEIHITNYRSLRDVTLKLGPLNVVTGPNGSGKSNLYRVLSLLATICDGGFSRTLAAEGGLNSVIWAGERRNTGPVQLRIAFTLDEWSYELVCGFTTSMNGWSRFALDPQVKEEAVWFGPKRKPTALQVERKAGLTRVRDTAGNWVDYHLSLSQNESIFSQLREPERFPELFRIREEIRQWRFYHHFRTDPAAPIRSPQFGVWTAALSHDGCDLASALQTILECTDEGRALESAISRALPGRTLEIQSTAKQGPSALVVALRTAGCLRPLEARELSDGTLKFLCLAAALLSPRPAPLIAINEPESGLHPDLLRPLAGLMIEASRQSQVWVTTHSRELAQAVVEGGGVRPIELALVDGETAINSEGLDE